MPGSLLDRSGLLLPGFPLAPLPLPPSTPCFLYGAGCEGMGVLTSLHPNFCSSFHSLFCECLSLGLCLCLCFYCYYLTVLFPLLPCLMVCVCVCLSFSDSHFPLSVSVFPFLSRLCLSLRGDHMLTDGDVALAPGSGSLVSPFAPPAATLRALETRRRSQCPASRPVEVMLFLLSSFVVSVGNA